MCCVAKEDQTLASRAGSLPCASPFTESLCNLGLSCRRLAEVGVSSLMYHDDNVQVVHQLDILDAEGHPSHGA